MPICVSDDELVFLCRQQNEEAFDMLQKRMNKKQDRLIYKKLEENRSCGLEYSDLKIVAMMALCNAIDSYDPKKTVFDAYYHLLLEREVVNEMKRFNSKNHTILNLAVSLDEPLEDGGHLSDIIGEEDDQLKAIRPIHILELAEDDASGLTPLQKAVLSYRALGYSYTEIGRILKKNYRQVTRVLSSVDKKLLQQFE